jgi:hypothetical protein
LIALKWRSAVVALGAFGALLTGVVPAAAGESEHALTIHFMKVCPANTCTGVLLRKNGKVIRNSGDNFIAKSGSGYPIIHFTALETVSSSHGTLNLTTSGTIDCSVAPTRVVADGTVSSGRWNGEDMTGSLIHEVGERVNNDPCSSNPAYSHTFRGTLWVFHADD